MRRHAGKALFGLILFGACAPGAVDWGFDAIDTLPTPADDATLGCGDFDLGDDKATARSACEFGAGARAHETLGVPKETLARLPIRHVIVAMKENRSFDMIFGALHDQGQPEVEAIPAGYVNPDLNGNPVAPRHATSTCLPLDPAHQYEGLQAAVNGGRMDGFVANAASSTGTDGAFALEFFDEGDLPFYYFLANTYAIADRDFASINSGTFANRTFMMFGTPGGVIDTGITYVDPATPSIFQLLMSAGYTWAVYNDDGQPLSGTLGWTAESPGVHSIDELYKALDEGTLPNVAFVDGTVNVEDDHPRDLTDPPEVKGDVQVGEAWLKKLYDHAVTSPQWERLAILYTYDEGGAFFDHVPPPDGCAPVPSRAAFRRLGPRVPLITISPWSRRHYVSHVVRDHTAITRLIEALFDLPALTARDANSDALLDMFDFSCGRDLSVPGAPDAGTGGCDL